MAIAREGDFLPPSTQPVRPNIIESFRTRVGTVEHTESPRQRTKRSFLSRFKTSPKEAVLAVAALILGAAIPAGVVAGAASSRPNEASWANGVGRQDSRQSPSLKATLEAQKAANAAKSTEQARVINDRVQAYQEGLTTTAMTGPDGATPLPIQTPTPQGELPREQLVSNTIDGAEVKLNQNSVTNTLPNAQSVLTPTPTLRVDAGGNFGGEVNASGN